MKNLTYIITLVVSDFWMNSQWLQADSVTLILHWEQSLTVWHPTVTLVFVLQN